MTPIPEKPILSTVSFCGSLLDLSLGLVFAANDSAESPGGMFETATLEFVADVTVNNEKLAGQVREAFANPDRSPEAVGFYLVDDVTSSPVKRPSVEYLYNGNRRTVKELAKIRSGI